ncbi:MAG: DUF4380 domain-containing protein, partial [Cyclobacteriaceae bacterium]|nr:DUF4380 domain-containing protein [Cyclobacteriaceae bacterium HetDA_MAG_MS6]
LSFFPVANDPLGIESFNALKSVKKSSGVCWYEFHPDSVKRAQKLYEDGKEGWLAHKNGDMLFLKTFQDLNQDEIPPGHGEVEIYAHKNGLYVELENHSQFQSLAPGDSFRYTVRWYFKPIPDEIKADSGSQQLVDWVRQLANRTARQ